MNYARGKWKKVEIWVEKVANWVEKVRFWSEKE